MEWNYRKNEMPRETDLYLVATKTGKVCEALYKIDRLKFEKRWGDEIKNVTHWMEMPKHPYKNKLK